MHFRMNIGSVVTKKIFLWSSLMHSQQLPGQLQPTPLSELHLKNVLLDQIKQQSKLLQTQIQGQIILQKKVPQLKHHQSQRIPE